MIDDSIKHLQQLYTDRNSDHFRELAAARQRREFWRNLVGGLLVMFGVPVLWFAPFWLPMLFGQ